MKNVISSAIKKLEKSGFFSIFMSSILSNVLVFLGGTIIVRVLSKNDYGIYAYILNCTSMLMLLNDWGTSQATLQFLLEANKDEKKKSSILKFSIKMVTIAASVSGFLILLSPLFYPFTIVEAKKLTPLLFLIPILTMINSLIPMVLRANMENKKYARLQLFSTFINYLFLITLSLAFGLIGAVISQYVYYIVLLLYGIYLAKPFLKNIKTKGKLKKDEKKDFLKFSISCQVNNSIGGLLLIVDTFLIGLMIKDSQTIASYKVGSAIPHALTFIYTCVTVYMMPLLVKHNKDFEWIKKALKKMIIYGGIGYGIIFSIIIFASYFIINLIYGKAYIDTVPVMIILVIGLFFTSAFKVPCANILTSMKKVKVNIYINIVSVALNFILNIIFINEFGYTGAAMTTTIINVLSSIAYIVIVSRVLKKEKLLNDTK